MKKNKFLVLALSLTLGLISACEAQNSAELSCIASIHRSLALSARSEPRSFIEADSQWRVLNDDEVRQIMLTVSKSNALDCARRSPEQLVLDRWNHRLTVAVRRTPDEQSATGDKLEFMVWSNGVDGIAGTEDDIVSPHGKEAPPELTSATTNQ
jgi:hypothetical protein